MCFCLWLPVLQSVPGKLLYSTVCTDSKVLSVLYMYVEDSVRDGRNAFLSCRHQPEASGLLMCELRLCCHSQCCAASVVEFDPCCRIYRFDQFENENHGLHCNCILIGDIGEEDRRELQTPVP